MSDNEAELDRLIAVARRHDRPAPAETERAWASLEAAMIGGVGPSVPIELGTTAGAAAGGLGIKSLVVVCVTVITAATTAIVAGAIETRDREAIVRTDSAPESRASSRSEVPAPATLPAEIAPSVAAPPAITPAPDLATSRPRAVPSEAVEPADPPASTLAEEARLLGEVWRDLNAGENTAALAKVHQHMERFPNSPLARERMAARIVAWCAERKPWAAAQARSFLADRGDGTLAERVERACDLPKKD